MPKSKIKLNAGFTLLETVIALAIVVILVGLYPFLNIDELISRNFESNISSAVTSIIRARSESINNIGNSPHGFKIIPGSYIIFEGQDYVSRNLSKDKVIPQGSNDLVFSGIDEIVFSQLSGDSTASDSFTITRGTKMATIHINYEGRIDW
ncbi:MAG: hypothetical protein A3B86_02930 [Candidatus Yanofskybacteria bacterium RIFCSPHIGHO2_02_FULL_38_22b]|uniref:General secretion pathway GspH domain-containing protein n=1 Tax=Candidatus Yanofskybacteria bacterium RIFCSPHIGHO2_02_FULL_38_22b TaxID=1802673 RepID=A0A1F8F3K7_9BACT|nr:MAG: hypothetical protein A2816_02520 [Candidatus Yanofskybacteria bacterium RIFCSPHIGHO2_01_FULL_39_44]OGN06826.1 MAG: hypothetical protein A3B86_02930 [Candidatus Yanofskybacteria bacterium RIFCSPHIGHO2_02_FULL_38_22b]OGN20721.1 MAG: hypothetical protein A2910_00890 [Candidatus Yanofskybacteria bacterium RIFCSPLOWO2_01_FULL_39_28]